MDNPVFNFFLIPFFVLVRIATAFDRWFRSRHAISLNAFTVSVGNLTMGGTGKTPWVIKVVQDLQSLGQKPAVLTRGYLGALKGSGDSDEVLLMKEKCPGVPIGVGADRKASAQRIRTDASITSFVLDDGFQHWPIRRHLDMVCVDATNPWRRLRESVSSLRRAQVVVITRCELVSPKNLADIEARVRSESPASDILHGRFQSVLWSVKRNAPKDPRELDRQRVLALSAIGNPVGFEMALEDMGAHVTPLRFRDHHIYSEADLQYLQEKLTSFDGFLVTTEKDWVKLRKTLWDENVFVLKIEAILDELENKRWLNILREKLIETKIPV